MFSNIKIVFIALLISVTTFAQQTETTENEVENLGHKVGNITVGAYFPIVFGNNFVNKGMDLTAGGKIAVKINTYKTFYVGTYFSFFNGSVTDQVLLGNYSSTTNFLLGGVAGYDFHIHSFDISLGIGLGYSIYNNHTSGDNFKDTATAIWLAPEISYRFNPYLGAFIAPELRHDFMNTEVPKELEDTFKGVNYVNISFGLRINLGNGYKYQEQ